MKFIKKHGKGSVKPGSAIVLVVFVIVLLSIMGVGLLSLSYGARLNAIRIKNETVATLAAEAGYEKAVFWMAQQDDMLFRMKSGGAYTPPKPIIFENSTCTYTVQFNSFIGSKPIYKITSIANVGQAQRAVEVLVSQDVGGWDMGMCRVPNGTDSTEKVNFANGEIIDMPIHINSYRDKFDSEIDIHIIGNPTFLRPVSMSESRTSSGGADKYSGVMNCFSAGIDFLQPDSQITDEVAIANKVAKFETNTIQQFRFKPNPKGSVPNVQKAVQLEFYVENGNGKVRITNNCAVRGYLRPSNVSTYDWMVKPNFNATKFERYFIYAYHYIPATGNRFVYDVNETYVTQEVGGVHSAPGGQIFVDGDVVIGGWLTNHSGNQVVKGNITVVATENIWIADSILVDGSHDALNNGVPSASNPNALGLIAQGAVKIVDPGMTENDYQGDSLTPIPTNNSNLAYEPIGIVKSGAADSYLRYLPDPLVIEAVITSGGGGFGAENVGKVFNNKGDSFGDRKEYSGKQDDLILRGALADVIRGVVGLVDTDGFVKHYYVDERVLQGILPGDMWLKRKYIPTAAGWSDYRP